MKRLIAAALVALALTGAAVAHAGWVPPDFADVLGGYQPGSQSAPHSASIDYVREQGWFGGYPNPEGGLPLFKPDERITPEQMTTVLTRAFPHGMTRAQFASFMRGGERWAITCGGHYCYQTIYEGRSTLHHPGLP